MEWRYLTNCLNRLGNELKSELDANEVNASFKLRNSIDRIIETGDGRYELSIRLEEYFKFVEQGRKAGKWPPINKIREWIVVKKLLPEDSKKLPSATYLISRKIAKKGIPARPLLQKSIDSINWDDEIDEAVRMDLLNELGEGIDNNIF